MARQKIDKLGRTNSCLGKK